jgi:hypothetical protein
MKQFYHKSITLLIILMVMSVLQAKAVDIFVSTSAQLATACTNAASGHVIKIAAGTYDGPFSLINKSGVTLQSYNGTVYLRGNANAATNGMIILYIENSSNITVTGLKFTRNWGNFADGIQIRGAGNAVNITNCEFYDIGWSTSKTTLPNAGQNAHALVVVGSTATSYTNIFIGGNTIRDCITGYSESMTIAGNVSNFLIENNTLYGNTNIGIDCMGHFAWTGAPANVNYARSGIVKNNVVRDYAGPASLDAAGGIYIDGGSFITVENNRVYNYKVGFSVGCETPNKTNSGNIIRNNRVYNCNLSGIFVGSNQSTSVVQNTQITGNVFYKNGFGTYDNGQIAFQNNSGTIVKNNILYPTNGRFALVQMGGTTTSSATISYNLYYRDNADINNLYLNINGDANAVKANPQFVNAGGSDFHIQTSSPCINAGDPGFSAGSGEVDMDGQARVQNSRVEIGADEVATSGGGGGTITVDGNASDWSSKPSIATNGTGGLTTLKAADNSTYLFVLAQGSSISTNYEVLIDSDNNNSGTGEYVGSDWPSTGFNYMVENGTLYAYAGTGTNWSWTSLGAISAVKNTTVMEARIPKSSLGALASSIRLAVVSINSSWTKVGFVPATGGNGASYTLGSVSGRAESRDVAEELSEADRTQVYPNPASSVVNIEYTLHQESEVCVDIFDLSGRHISNLEKQRKPAGHYKQSFDLNTSSGMYLLKIFKEGKPENILLTIQ